jgi:hypothetical protein
MTSGALARASAALFGVAGLALLFASDRLLALLVPGIPAGSAWLGQLVAAGWLGIAFHDWIARDQRLGGIYGRPTVLLNLVVCTISALGLVKADGAPPAVRWAALPFAVLAAIYGAAMYRGPLDG